MTIEISAYDMVIAIIAIIGMTFALWNLKSFLRVRRVVNRPRSQGAQAHGDSRRVETALMRRTFIQFLLWLAGTALFVGLATVYASANTIGL